LVRGQLAYVTVFSIAMKSLIFMQPLLQKSGGSEP